MHCTHCSNQAALGSGKCLNCQLINAGLSLKTTLPNPRDRGRSSDRSMAELYPKYYKAIPPDWDTIDVYGVCKLFPVDDDSGCIRHAVKKLLVPGIRTGGKSFYDDIREARDTLNRWMQLNPEPVLPPAGSMAHSLALEPKPK